MLLQTLALVATYSLVESREMGRPTPTITNSLVNLGKMEISFYLNGRDNAPKSERSLQSPSPYFLPKSEPILDEPCPCSSLRNIKDSFFGNPGGILNKLLMNNNLFSSNKETVKSTLCCESHEHIEEGTVVFEFPPNKLQKPTLPRANSLPFMPFIFENLVPKNPMLPSLKTKAIEIFLFPKKKEGGFDFSKFQKKNKDGIQIVGDKNIKNNFISVPTPPPAMKIDTTQSEKVEKEFKKEKDVPMNNMEFGTKPNSV